MAGLVDAALIVGGFLVFVLVFVACTVHPPVGKPALIGAAVGARVLCGDLSAAFFQFRHRHAGDALRQDRPLYLRR